jgi:hypothetical protein
MYDQNKEFQDAVAGKYREALSRNQNVPPMRAGGGMGNAAPSIPERPDDMEKGSDMARKFFGL